MAVGGFIKAVVELYGGGVGGVAWAADAVFLDELGVKIGGHEGFLL